MPATTPDTGTGTPTNAHGNVREGAEPVEGRSLAKGNANQRNTLRTQDRTNVPSGLERVREAAQRDKQTQFTTLLHHVNLDLLRESYHALKKSAAAGVDGVTWKQYGVQLEANLEDLHDRLHSGAYRAKPSRRVYIPKADGRQRPLGIAALEDKVAQRAVVEVLNAIYETDFLGFSYGFRPRRGAHDALDAFATAIYTQKVSWVLDADIRGFFDAIDHECLMKFVELRVADRRVLRLLRKWLNAGVMEDGALKRTQLGTPQGATVSPLLANIFLHYVLDRWTQEWRKHEAHGRVTIVRYADDFVLGFEHREDAERYLHALRERMSEHALELHPEKTRLIRFGRTALPEHEQGRGEKPGTFDFLGFTHICAKTRKGRYLLRRQTIRKRMQATLKVIKGALMLRRHEPVPQVGAWLGRVVRGYLAYYSVPTNSRILGAFVSEVLRRWRRALHRRGQRDKTTWAAMRALGQRWLPRVRVLHPWPTSRFFATHPRQEPGAGMPHAGICAGGA